MIQEFLDILNNSHTENAFVDAEKILQLIGSRIPGVLYQFKIDGNGRRSLPYVSQKVEEYIGLSAETVMNDVDKWFALVHPDDFPGFEKSIVDSMNNLSIWNWEGRFICFDNEVRWLQGSSTPEKLQDGSILWGGVILDNTERFKNEEALKKSEALHEKAQTMSRIGHWGLIPYAGEVTGSDELFRIFGLSKSEATFDKFIDVFHPDDRSMNLACIQRGIEHGESWNIKHRIVCPDGAEKWVHAIGEAVTDKNGNVIELIGTVQDITERKRRSEELQGFKNILDQTLDSVFIFDAESLLFTYVNEGAMQQTGYTREEMLGMHPYDIKPDYTETDFRALIAPLISRNEESINFEAIHSHKDGSRISVDISLQYVPLDGGRSSFVAIVRDITARAQLENELDGYRGVLETLVDERTVELSAARDAAEHSSQAKSVFLSRMSHELRTPLNAILGFGQMLELDEEGFTVTQKENVQEILEAGRHLLDLINDVLNLSKIESGKFEVFMGEVQLDKLLAQCLSLIQPQAADRDLGIVNHISGKGYIVWADFTRLKQVLVNLLSNAVKYNREHGLITLTSEIIDNKYCRILVTDGGNGITKDNLEKLFVPFEQLAETSNIEGTGIGLVISKHLMGLMGGSVGVKSTPGKGSTFWVDIVLVDGA